MKIQEAKTLARGIALTSVTPLTLDGDVDEKGIHALVNFFLDKGLSRENGFLVPNSTTGNFLALSVEEKKQVVRAFCEASGDRIPVAIGCNATRMADIIEIALFAQENGAFAVMVSPPFYWRPTGRQIIEHYRQICEAIDIGVILYNNHWATQYDLDQAVLDEILEFNNVISLKESTYSITKLSEVVRAYADRLSILNGLGEPVEPMYARMGCTGFTTFTIGNALPEIPVRLYELMENGNFEDARRLANLTVPLDQFMGGLGGGQYIPASLHLLHSFGICKKTVRPPLLHLDDQDVEQLEFIVKRLEDESKRI
jgi:dihydrodipicolinate synthase/N-acetylneuraminate lyase